jgi:biotin-(acetyl-CoA carboxylase) ligase
VLVDLARTLQRFDNRGFTPDQTGWNALDIFRGKAIRAASQRDIVVGVGEGADELGRYRLRCDDGAITPIIAGDISLSFDSPGSALS